MDARFEIRRAASDGTMGQIIELHPRETPPSHGAGGASERPGPASVDEATQRLIASVRELIQILEMSHRRIRALIDMVPDADAAARLARDHALLSATLREAKAKVISLDAGPHVRNP